MEKYIIETKTLVKQYKNKKAVDKVNVHIKKGEVYGFIGRNGAGKTTFLKMIANLISPSSGEVLINGVNSDYDHSKIGVLIENPGLYLNLSAYDNLMMKCILLKIKNPKDKVNELLNLVKLDKVKKKKVNNFSLGMKQRLGVAMALVSDPEILLLDEPINGLDPQGIIEIRELIHKLQSERNITIVISSHILEELAKISNRYGIISNGVLVKEMTSEELDEISKDYLNIVVDDIDKTKMVLDKLAIKDYEVIDDSLRVYEESDDAFINKNLVNNGIAVSEIYRKKENVEEMFIKLMGGENYA